jgi:GTP-binding protein
MKIKSSEFAKCAVEPSQYPTDGLTEIALIGKSNVGKSSLINTLIHRKGLAKTSSTPGKTQTLNFYKTGAITSEGTRLNFYLVDLPGFGYAKTSRSERMSWKRAIDRYFKDRAELKGALVILDARRDIGETELEIYKWLRSLSIPVVTVLTKCDKLSNNGLARQASKIKRALVLNNFISFSSVKGKGKQELTNSIESLIVQDLDYETSTVKE